MKVGNWGNWEGLEALSLTSTVPTYMYSEEISTSLNYSYIHVICVLGSRFDASCMP